MKIAELVKYWEKHARGRLTADNYRVALSDDNQARLEKLSELFPRKSQEELIRDLLSAALDELETSFPYVQGERVVAFDELGDEIYEDKGMTPRFVDLSQKHMRELKARAVKDVA
ncbi:pilin assembly protein [Marinobacteraceae bacterium S3BR75-40.1]